MRQLDKHVLKWIGGRALWSIKRRETRWLKLSLSTCRARFLTQTFCDHKSIATHIAYTVHAACSSCQEKKEIGGWTIYACLIVCAVHMQNLWYVLCISCYAMQSGSKALPGAFLCCHLMHFIFYFTSIPLLDVHYLLHSREIWLAKMSWTGAVEVQV